MSWVWLEKKKEFNSKRMLKDVVHTPTFADIKVTLNDVENDYIIPWKIQIRIFTLIQIPQKYMYINEN